MTAASIDRFAARLLRKRGGRRELNSKTAATYHIVNRMACSSARLRPDKRRPYTGTDHSLIGEIDRFPEFKMFDHRPQHLAGRGR